MQDAQGIVPANLRQNRLAETIQVDGPSLAAQIPSVARIIDILATGICGILNLSVPSFGRAHSRNPGYYFVLAGQDLSRAFLNCKHEAENQPGEQANIAKHQES